MSEGWRTVFNLCHEDSPVHGGANHMASALLLKPSMARSLPLLVVKSSCSVMLTNLHPFV